MRKMALWLVTAGLGLSTLVGCGQNSMTVRGQAPSEGSAMPGMMPPQNGGGPPYPTVAPGSMPYGMPSDPTTGAASGYWAGNGWSENGPNAAMPGYQPSEFGYGTEREYKFRYKEPRDLRYPPVGDSPAVVQYPYYTFKGPDDFFVK